jgi:hypothetical protein
MPRYDTISTNGLVLELNRRKDGCGRLLLVNVIGKIAKLVLNLSAGLSAGTL